MSDFLKGNFKPKREVKDSTEDRPETADERFRKQALKSIGGSMVYVEKTPLAWDGEEKQGDK